MPHAVAPASDMPTFHTIVSQASRLLAAPGAFAALRRASNFLRFVLGFGSGWRSLEAETRAAAALLEGVAEPVVIDAGAHAGEWTDALLRRLGPARRVSAILAEPSPDFAARLREKFPSATVLPIALGDANREVVFYEAGAIGSVYRDDAATAREIRVPMERLDALVPRLGLARIDLLKLDVEGAELDVLRGLADYLRPDFVRALTFEFGVNNLRSRTFFRDFWELLAARGYRIALIDPRGRLAPLARYATDLEWFHGVSNYAAYAPPAGP